MTRAWIQVKIRSSVDAGELLAMLDSRAWQGAWQEHDLLRLYWSAEEWSCDALQELKQTVRRLSHESEPVIEVQGLADQDWNAQWAASVEPIRVGRRVAIRPSWKQVEVEPGTIELVIDPRQAFGTGHHATTQLLIELLEDRIGGGERVLDVGTGSGLLAMVALRLGAVSAVAIDQDPVAINCAREYAAINGFGPELALQTATLAGAGELQAGPFDLVLANLDRRTLLESGGVFISYLQQGARLLLSGVLEEDQVEIASMVKDGGGMVARVTEREGWVALDVVVPVSCEE